MMAIFIEQTNSCWSQRDSSEFIYLHLICHSNFFFHNSFLQSYCRWSTCLLCHIIFFCYFTFIVSSVLFYSIIGTIFSLFFFFILTLEDLTFWKANAGPVASSQFCASVLLLVHAQKFKQAQPCSAVVVERLWSHKNTQPHLNLGSHINSTASQGGHCSG